MNINQFLAWMDAQHQPSKEIYQKPLVMGIVNVTPDSFSDGGAYIHLQKAHEQVQKLIAQGVDIVDIGGESTRPGADPLPTDIELERVIPLIQMLKQSSDICISIDTYKPQVMREAIEAGAHIINDIYGLQSQDSLMMAKKLDVPVCIMHMQGNPKTMQEVPNYPLGILEHLKLFFQERIHACQEVGINIKRLILDPGFGFGKQVKDNLQIVKHIKSLKQGDCPILLGLSRKSTIGAVLKKEIHERLAGSLALEVYAALQGVGILRTHEVEKTQNALTMLASMYQSG